MGSTLPLVKSTQNNSTMGKEPFTNRQQYRKMRSCSCGIRCNNSLGGLISFITTSLLAILFVARPTEAFSAGAAASKRTASSSSSGFGVSSKLSEQKSGTIVVAPIHLPEQKQQEPNDHQLPVLTQDLVDLADLRYNEWVANQENSIESTNNNPLELSPPTQSQSQQSQPSRHAFRMATAEIAQERQEAVSFLARYQDNHNKPPISVGAAELSPIEFEGATTTGPTTTISRIRWYVTDVVTSSQHRRMGVANHLMDALERHAHELESEQTAANDATTTTSTTLYLHVKPENAAALQFYQNPKRAYAEPTLDEVEGVNLEKLASNAGITDDQILLCKTLTSDNVPPALEENNNDSNNSNHNASTPTGFGGNTSAKKKPKKKAKRKRK